MKNIFFKYSRVTYQKTRIGTLNSNIESIFRNVEKCSIDMRKTVLFGKFPNFTAFLLPVQSIFMIFEKWFDIRVQCLNALLLNRHKAIFQKNIFLTLLQGIPNLKVRIFEKYKSQKKNKNSFEMPWPRAIKCPPNWIFQKKCRTLMYIYKGWQRSQNFTHSELSRFF